uniref:DNA repair protein REV1 n=1 Tax=Parastrongyloides trichosuri TaxID=131310 RepID=A0A0N5A2A6_PARTI
MSLNGTIVIDDSDEDEDPVKNSKGKPTIRDQWVNYMGEKIQKLNKQNQELEYGQKVESQLFKGLSISINGYTDPPFLELKEMFVKNGGEFHNYYLHGKTTYVIATNIAMNKIKQLRKNEYYVHPNWIVDSIYRKQLQQVNEYFIIKDQKEKYVDARNPHFIEKYYGRSRLHLISTMAQEAKQWVREQQEKEYEHEFSLRYLLDKISNDDVFTAPAKVVCHIDMDCFFVSVGLISRPELRGKPVAVTHSRTENHLNNGYAEIASCSYEARKLGLTNGMLVRDAAIVCKQLIKIPYQFEEYKRVSRIFYETVAAFTLNMQAISCDEMYVDFTELCETLKIVDVEEMIRIIRKTINEKTQCTCSIGVGSNMLLARLATRNAKPNGQFIVNDIPKFMSDIRVADLPGVGNKIIQRIGQIVGRISTCNYLLRERKSTFIKAIGVANGEKLYNHIRGIDNRNVLDVSERKSVSCDINYGIRFTTKQDMLDFLNQLSNELEKKLTALTKNSRHVALKLMIRDPTAPVETTKYLGHGLCTTVSKGIVCDRPISTGREIYNKLVKCFEFLNPTICDVRGVAAHLTNLSGGKKKADITIEDYFRTMKENANKKDVPVVMKTPEKSKGPIELIVISDSPEVIVIDDTLEERKKEETPLGMIELRKTERRVFSKEFFTEKITGEQEQILRKVFKTYVGTGLFDKLKIRHKELLERTKNKDNWKPFVRSLKRSLNEFAIRRYGAIVLR